MEFSPSVASTVEGIVKYVDRGDPANYDFRKEDLIQDSAWHDMDLSGIVPEAGANHLVHISVTIQATVAENYLILQKKGNVNFPAVGRTRTQVADIMLDESDIFVMMDADRKIEYQASTGNWSRIDVAVRGWLES